MIYIAYRAKTKEKVVIHKGTKQMKEENQRILLIKAMFLDLTGLRLEVWNRLL